MKTNGLWDSATEYSAMIGGILYKNVKNPLVVNGKPLISLTRNRASKMLGVSLLIHGKRGNLIARVTNNNVDVLDEAFTLAKGDNRVSVVRKDGAQVLLDLAYGIQGRAYEIEVSALFVCNSYPVILHPERTKCGSFNDNAAPNISRLTLSAEKGSQGGGISLNNLTIYLLGMCIENLLNGVSLTVGSGHASK